MSNIQALSSAEHGSKRWFKATDFLFAARDRVVAIGFNEIPKAMMSLPLGFTKVGDTYTPVVIQGLLPNQNLLVSSRGQWLADFVPVVYSTMPFRLAKNTDGEYILCVDVESRLITDGPAGYRLFDDERNLAAEASASAQALIQFEKDRPRIAAASKLLAECNVIEPWPINLQQGEETIKAEGFHRINEARLADVSGETLVELRNTGGLMLAYAQLFSMQHLQHLGQAAQRTHWVNRMAELTNKVAPLDIVDDNGILSFANL